MIESTVAQPRSRFSLCRVEPDGSKEVVSRHPTFEEGYRTGTHIVTVRDDASAYSLFFEGRCLAKFGHARLMPRRVVSLLVEGPVGDTVAILNDGEEVPVKAEFRVRGDSETPDLYEFCLPSA